MEEIIKDFIDWAKDCGQDVYYVFDNTDEAIEEYKRQKQIGDTFLGDIGKD